MEQIVDLGNKHKLQLNKSGHALQFHKSEASVHKSIPIQSGHRDNYYYGQIGD